MPSKNKKRQRPASSKAVPEKALKKKDLTTAGKTARATRALETSKVDSKALSNLHCETEKCTKAIDRCENLIHKLSAEVAYLKSLTKPGEILHSETRYQERSTADKKAGNKDAEIVDRNEPDRISKDRNYVSDDSEEDEPDPCEETAEEEDQPAPSFHQRMVMNRKASLEPDIVDVKVNSKEEKFRFQVQKGKSVYLNGVFEPLEEILSSGNWIFVTCCCERDEALDEKIFMRAWTNFTWSGVPPTVLCASEVGKGIALLMENPKDMKKGCSFTAELRDYDKREVHETRAAKFHGSSGVPLVLRIPSLASVVHESYLVKALHEEFPCNKFHVYQMLDQNSVNRVRDFFVVFSEAPAHIVKCLYFRELPEHKGKVRAATLVVDDVCCSCETLTPHSENDPCKYWVYLWTSVEGRCFRGKRLAEQWLAEKQNAEEKTVRRFNLERPAKPATAHGPSYSSIPQANNSEGDKWLDALGLSESVPSSFGTIEADEAKSYERFNTIASYGIRHAESAKNHHERRDAGLSFLGISASSKNMDRRAAPVFRPLRDVD